MMNIPVKKELPNGDVEWWLNGERLGVVSRRMVDAIAACAEDLEPCLRSLAEK